jgi:ABC-2 type transport system permease protein
MLLHIAKKEWKEALRDSRFRFAAGLLLILLFASMVVSYNYYQNVNQEYQQAKQTVRQEWEGQVPKNPHSAAHFGTYAFKPVQPLSLIDNGLDKYLGVSIFLEAHKQNTSQYRQIADQNDLARFAELTPAFVFTYLVPLLIILVSFGTFTTEKENGTLQLLLSQGISKFQLGLGKITGIWLLMLALLLPIFLLGLIFILSSEFQADDLLRYALLIITLLFYYGVFVNLSVAVSAWAKSSNVALVGLLGFWIVSALLVPKFTSNLSKMLHPAPSAIEYQAEIKENLEKGVDGHNPFSEKSKLFEDSVLQANKVDSVHKLPFNYSGLIMQAGEEHETVVYAKAMKKLNNIYFAQLQTHQASAFLSPTILVKMLSMQIAKTDLQTHYDFSQQAENYRIALVRDLNYELKDKAKYGQRGYISSDKDFFKKNIKFDYKPVSMTDTLKNTWASLLFLMVWFAVSLVAVKVILK